MDNITQDIFLHICEYLSELNDIFNLCCVCKKFNVWLKSSNIWLEFFDEIGCLNVIDFINIKIIISEVAKMKLIDHKFNLNYQYFNYFSIANTIDLSVYFNMKALINNSPDILILAKTTAVIGHHYNRAKMYLNMHNCFTNIIEDINDPNIDKIISRIYISNSLGGADIIILDNPSSITIRKEDKYYNILHANIYAHIGNELVAQSFNYEQALKKAAIKFNFDFAAFIKVMRILLNISGEKTNPLYSCLYAN